MLETHPTGKHLVEVCTNVSCSLTGGDQLWTYLKKKLALAGAGTTADGRYTLREVECLGSCGTSPAMLVDEEMHEQLTPSKVDQILGSLT
jgi:NADH-quinone oxidoreductase subunit E